MGEKINVEELRDDTYRDIDYVGGYNVQDYADNFIDYNSGDISDIFWEIADSFTSIYYTDIAEFLKESFDDVNDYIYECGVIKNDDGYPDIMGTIQNAEREAIYNVIMEKEYDLLLYYSYVHLFDKLNIKEITEEEQEFVENNVNNTIDNGWTLQEMINELNDKFQGGVKNE